MTRPLDQMLWLDNALQEESLTQGSSFNHGSNSYHTSSQPAPNQEIFCKDQPAPNQEIFCKDSLVETLTRKNSIEFYQEPDSLSHDGVIDLKTCGDDKFVKFELKAGKLLFKWDQNNKSLAALKEEVFHVVRTVDQELILAEHAEEKEDENVLEWHGEIPHTGEYQLNAKKSINSEAEFCDFLEMCEGAAGIRVTMFEPNRKLSATKKAALARKEREAKKKQLGSSGSIEAHSATEELDSSAKQITNKIPQAQCVHQSLRQPPIFAPQQRHGDLVGQSNGCKPRAGERIQSTHLTSVP
ncbi:hypothetical protein MJO29_001714 [Puccinia striiformis f. sp. tritici]|nr:hypothetical protein MJO29_001714 [Puccinia striiformis f. sp. tritici]KAI9620405.1 hypothetical protein H4Q26_013617 [Puccinia striiformis f. sp. tritici PST-130]